MRTEVRRSWSPWRMTSGCLWLWLTVLARERKVSIRLVGLYAEPAIRAVRRAACLGEQAAVSGQPAYATVTNLSPSGADSGPLEPAPADLREKRCPVSSVFTGHP